MKIPRLTSQSLDVILEEIQQALDPIQEKYGLASLELGEVKYNDLSFSGKLSGALPKLKEIEDGMEKLEAQFFALQHGLPEDILGQKFTSNRVPYTVHRIAPRNPKYPVIAAGPDGKLYKFTLATVKAAFADVPGPRLSE